MTATAKITDSSHGHQAHHPTPFASIWMLIGNEVGEIWVVAAYGAAVGLLSLATPLAVSALVQSVAFSTILQPLVVLTILLGGVLIFYSLLRALQSRVVELLQERLFLRVAGELAYRLPRAQIGAFDREHAPELVNRFFDVLTVQKSASTLLLDGLALVLQTSMGMLLLAFYHPLLLVFDALLAFGLFVVIYLFSGGAVQSSIDESKAKFAMAAWLEEIVRNPTAFRGEAGQHTALVHTDTLGAKYLSSRRKHWKVLFRQIVGTLALKSIAHVVLLGLGGWLVIKRQLTLGQLVAAELVLTAVLTGVSKFGKQLESWYDLCAAADKLGHLLGLPLERANGETLMQSNAISAKLQKVTFAYGPLVPVLNGAELTVAAGSRIAIVGKTGVGRSTLLDLLYGLRTPSDGQVLVEGRDVRELSLSSLRSRIELVRDAEVFEGTVEDNVRMGRKHLDGAAIHRALAAVGLTSEISALPDGIFTKLTSGGSPLSPGEARQLVLARAIADSPGMLLIDETLDHVFPLDRPALLTALLGPAVPWTVVVVSNRPDVLAACTHIFEFSSETLTPVEIENV